MAPEFTYSTHALPNPLTSSSPPQNLGVLAQKYAALRLEALLTSPNAFASTHAIESAFMPMEWTARIWKPDAVVFVCLALRKDATSLSPPSDSDPLDSGVWVGSAVLRGPLPISEYALPREAGGTAAGTDEEETKWQMTAVFSSAAHRGCGIGKMLVQAGKDYALARTADMQRQRNAEGLGPTRARFRVMVHPENLPVLALYSKSGFVDAGRATGQEAYRTNGDLSLWDLKLKSLTEEQKVWWTTKRLAVVLEWLGQIQ